MERAGHEPKHHFLQPGPAAGSSPGPSGQGALAHEIAEFDDDGIRDGVGDRLAAALAGDEAGPSQGREMAGGIWLALADGVGDDAHRGGLLHQESQDGESGWLRESFEALRKLLNEVVGQVRHSGRIAVVAGEVNT